MPDRCGVCEKNEIEMRPLCSLGQLNVVAKVRTCVDLLFRMEPRCDMVPGRMKERSECKLSPPSDHVIHDELRSQSAAASKLR
jgi:hypothetical protein